MVNVGLSFSVTHDTDESPVVSASVVSSEDENGGGDGNTNDDIQWDGSTLLLRAERDGGGEGRVYTITITATDDFGRSSTEVMTVTVPKSKGKKK
jgi:hypothetical protein